MLFIKNDKGIKVLLLFIAVLIVFSSLYFSHLLAKDLSVEEKLKMEVWAEAIRTINSADENMDLSLVLKVLNANNTIPVIVVGANDDIQFCRNIEIERNDTVSFLQKELVSLKKKGREISVGYAKVYYDDSLVLKRLSVYPYVQLFVVLVFVLVVLMALLSFKKAEQNRVWIGLSKETAHQLGTPVSSMIAWLELFRLKYPNDDLIPAMNDDVLRLQMITNRFSKIGSIQDLEEVNLAQLLEETINYMSRRSSNKVEYIKCIPAIDIFTQLNSSLFAWVIENLCKNAVDAMDGAGIVTIVLSEELDIVVIEVIDTGKGIQKNKYKAIFAPGYTTKARGWGLGLSLARRIVEEYHKGCIYVKESVVNVGTTFRIELKK